MTALFLTAAVCYVAASMLFVSDLSRGDARPRQLGRLVLVGAVVCHLALIGLLCTEKQNPLRDLRGALDLAAVLIVVMYLLATWRKPLAAVGAVVTPMALGMLVVARLTPRLTPTAEVVVTAGRLSRVHIALASAGAAAFAFATGAAVIYLLQDAGLRRKRGWVLSAKLPSLSVLDAASQRLILLGFPVFSLAVVTGLVWWRRLPSGPQLRPEYVIAAVSWAVYALLILGRFTAGWRGRRAAWLTVVGFLALTAVLLIYWARRTFG